MNTQNIVAKIEEMPRWNLILIGGIVMFSIIVVIPELINIFEDVFLKKKKYSLKKRWREGG